MTIYDDVEAEYACTHPMMEVRYSITSNGKRQWRDQCITCGYMSEFLKYSHPRVMAVVHPVPLDEGLRTAWRNKISMEVQHRYAVEHDRTQMERLRELDERTTAWWAEYNRYLQSGDWQARRRMVLERDSYLCQSCRQARATQAHHLTYDHGFDAPLFELVAVCQSCHERITMLDRERRGTT